MTQLCLILLSISLFGGESVYARGILPDVSNEGIVHRFSTYKDVALFHYNLPSELSKATFEFAAFQNRPDCPSIWIITCIQHGSYPVINPDNGTFAKDYYIKRSELDCIRIPSAYESHSNSLYPVFNPLPGPWFTVSYISPDTPTEGKLSLLKGECRYSVGSIGIWNKADNIQSVFLGDQTLKTSSRYSYFKILVPDSVPHFKIILSNCKSLVKDISRPWFKEESCVELAALRARAIPFSYDQNIDQQFALNISTQDVVELNESRPFKSNAYYYILLISNGKISIDLKIEYGNCGEPGLYGETQRNWFLEEKGLVWNANKTSGFREPEAGFQIFHFPENDPNDHFLPSAALVLDSPDKQNCVSRFELTRIDEGREFYTVFLLQGRRWYTNWITVRNTEPIFTRFDINQFMDLGATLVIHLEVDINRLSYKKEYSVLICLSHNREPMISTDGMMSCHEDEKTILNVNDTLGNLYIPFPEYGAWFLGSQILSPSEEMSSGISLMVSLDVRLQPCGYRLNEKSEDLCGPNGLCYLSNDGLSHYSACKCFSGYRGWTCDDATYAFSKFQQVITTLLLTMSNLAFLPAVLFAMYYKLWTQSLAYFTTMLFSTFYHMCDEEAQEKSLPHSMDSLCNNLYVNNEVLQFCDFYSATLSFWITIIALSKFNYKLVSFLNTIGVILIAVLVQYNRTGAQVFAIPIPLGLFLLLISYGIKGKSRGRIVKPNTRCLYFMIPGISCTLFALALFVLIETSETYAYVHSAWHIFMALSLCFFVPLCKERTKNEKDLILSGVVQTSCSEEVVHDSSTTTQISTISNALQTNPSPLPRPAVAKQLE
ncbi:post-GPI attachment to proteins factor 6 [Lepeophtheirus salmonis]|uniref:post-GPI attachment to proteins factor 6 n=1 Tax=Lepeophtheirus salmonis TaxID=72036 RepID=UPI001AEB4EB2|nr:post-GPI attachment to proteins factor 6-like [Lepeophtheirus salmonis]XP_040573657.1 post-GPI attachment to proteins factor 6-like [Lepeophtheirus salmonis]